MYDYGGVVTRSPLRRHRSANKPWPIIVFVVLFLFFVLRAFLPSNEEVLSPVITDSIQADNLHSNTPPPTPIALTAKQATPQPRTQFQTEIQQEIDNLFMDKRGSYGWYVLSMTEDKGYGSNYDFSFTAASINKIPIMMAFLQRIEDDTYSLNDDYKLESRDIEEGSGTLQYQKLDSLWKYRQLVEFAGHYSDNTAINAMHRLAGFGSAQKLVQNYKLLQTSIPKNTSSPKDMVTFLKNIYQKQVLSEDNLINLFYTALRDTEYEEDLIPEGIPSEIPVSHKIGWQVQVWSDCGIVFGQNPYAICVMTDGVAEQEAREVIPQVSRKIWLFESGNYNSSR